MVPCKDGELVKRVLRWVGQALVIGAITLALDYVLTATLFAQQKRALAEADAGNYVVYIPTPYHHDLIPNRTSTRVWGNVIYPWKTDQWGFRTGTCAPGEAERSREAIFVIGDSFTEALGSSYEDSFVGLMACDAAKQNKAVWNLGVASYSPAIYHRKIRAAAERLGPKPTEIFVFLDLSDIDDDANVYRIAADGTVVTASSPGAQKPMIEFDLGQFLVNNFTTFRFFYDLYLTSSFSYVNSVGRYRARWTVDPALLESWGRRGLEVAAGNLDKVTAICREWDCRVTLVVYPWPDNVLANDKYSIQVSYWRAWAAKSGVRFIDGFAPFFREPIETAMRKYYIAGDVHFTPLGNRLLYDEVRREIDADW
jgi:hypothetical protein